MPKGLEVRVLSAAIMRKVLAPQNDRLMEENNEPG